VKLKEKNIIHRDIKPSNYVGKNSVYKLTDFGLSKLYANELEKSMTYVGTPRYMSPEIFLGEPYTYKTDIWSLGIILY